MSAIDDAFAAALAAIDWDDPTAEAAMFAANQTFYADKLAANELPDFVVPTALPHFGPDGLRTVVALVLLLVNMYARHRDTADPFLSQSQRDALAALGALEAAFRLLNNPGPN